MVQLHDILDRNNYRRLVRTFGGMRIWVPKSGNLGHRNRRYFRQRDDRILRAKRRGKSIAALAQTFDLSLKTIYRILAGNGGPHTVRRHNAKHVRRKKRRR